MLVAMFYWSEAYKQNGLISTRSIHKASVLKYPLSLRGGAEKKDSIGKMVLNLIEKLKTIFGFGGKKKGPRYGKSNKSMSQEVSSGDTSISRIQKVVINL